MKNKVLYFLNVVAFITFALGACSLDSDTLIPLYMVIAGGGWLSLFYIANTERLRG